MTAAALPAAAHPARPSAVRLLGVVALVGSPMMLVQWLSWVVLGGRAPGPESGIAQAEFLLYIWGVAASAAGLRLLRATGRGRGAAVVTAIQAVGLFLASLQPWLDLTVGRARGGAFYAATDVAWPASHVYMLVVGVAVLRAGVWRGWRRWTPLACGLCFPLMAAGAGLFGRAAMGAVFGPATALAFGALAVALLTAPAPGDGR
ncbi:hypothetical protein [Roseisolibacter sp. H3M3-2]|uniref:hypothetical protein n=1 Tax=Roseisolibacter sp. H3M3-2 TaxID=3031323 RepID=UPI0023DCE919|nr:hypothetical protein [Roseisolibacter sp. H3M3-2]MDF1505558.1 hypothetical protein [Roseisolibacter sp. H3M3-2]